MDITEVEHPSITAENRDAFATHMEKFDSFEAAAVDGMALKAITGKPYKLPESIEKLPDDTTRSEFADRVNELFGRHVAKDVEGLADLDLKAGSATPDEPFDESFATKFKTWMVEKQIPKSVGQAAIEFFNKTVGEAQAEYMVKADAEAKQAAADRLKEVAACNQALIAKFGTKEKLDEETARMHRALLNHTGCTAEEAENVSKFLADREGATNPTIRRLLISNLAPLAKESAAPDGGGGPGGRAPAQQQDGLTEQILWPKK
jgi:hypothetical protein